MIEVIDDYLPEDLFKYLRDVVTCEMFPWFYNKSSVSDDNISQFIHMLYCNHAPSSPVWDDLRPVVEHFNPTSLFRVKFNATPRFSELLEKPLHYDWIGHNGSLDPNLKVCLLYINSNDGYTYFESGEKIESKENRAVFFPGDLKHSGTNCTDADVRLVMNINYYNA